MLNHILSLLCLHLHFPQLAFFPLILQDSNVCDINTRPTDDQIVHGGYLGAEVTQVVQRKAVTVGPKQTTKSSVTQQQSANRAEMRCSSLNLAGSQSLRHIGRLLRLTL